MNDHDLQKEVMAELTWEPAVHAEQIGVGVEDGVVVLSGAVDSYAEKLACEKAAKRVQGVRAVAQEIEVRIPSAMVRDDSQIALAAANALAGNVVVPRGKVEVKVEHGWVTLSGEVAWRYERDAAEDAVRYLTGVEAVQNMIRLKAGPSVEGITNQISHAFKRSALLDARNVEVTTADGTVRLGGRVRSWSEKEEAERAAWAAPGVMQVNNQIQVAR